ncbi:MAG: apolipoprotein N-acyltransferase [Candidatus Omnitrophica bacterium]|nr:apolipoprotein N-acyltransferase [Candidatus Omnitrophota bacterium]
MTIIPVILSAVFLYLSFPNIFFLFGLWPCAWFFAVPLFYSLSGKSLKERIFIGTIFSFSFYPILVSWFIPYSFAGYLCFVLFLAIQPVLFCVLYPFAVSEKVKLLYVPSLWVASEYVRGLLMAGFSWNLGHSQSFNIPVIQFADLFGGWGVSFVLIFVNFCLYRVLTKKKQAIYIAAIVGVVGLVLSYGALTLAGEGKVKHLGTKVLAVQPNIDSHQKLDLKNVHSIIQQQLALTHKGLERIQPDLIVWPETAVPVDYRLFPSVKKRVFQLAQQSQARLLVGAALEDGENFYNSAVLFEPEGKARNVYYKQQLVPFSEFLPDYSWARFLQKVMKIKTVNFTAGEKGDVFSWQGRDGQVHKGGVAICSEDLIGEVFRSYVKQGAQWVVVLLNDGWFKEDRALVMHAQNAIVHAVENRIPVLRVANTGWSCLIHPSGKIEPSFLKQQPIFNKEDVFVYHLPVKLRTSLYDLLGDIFCGLCVAFVIIIFILLVIKNTFNKKPVNCCGGE